MVEPTTLAVEVGVPAPSLEHACISTYPYIIGLFVYLFVPITIFSIYVRPPSLLLLVPLYLGHDISNGKPCSVSNVRVAQVETDILIDAANKKDFRSIYRAGGKACGDY